MLSMPPATTTSLWPREMDWDARVIAFRPEAQSLLMPVHMVSTGRPEWMEAWRAGDWPTPDGFIVPKINSEIWLGFREACDREDFIAVEARTGHGIVDKEPMKLPIGVRRAATITTSSGIKLHTRRRFGDDIIRNIL